MPFITPYEGPLSMKVSKRLGRPMECGEAWCGWSQLGETNIYVGVYQQRYKRLDFWTAGYTPKGDRDNFKMKHTWPINPQSVPQQAWRATFAGGVAAWHALTENEKVWYRNYGTRKGKTGFCIFMSRYLKSQ